MKNNENTISDLKTLVSGTWQAVGLHEGCIFGKYEIIRLLGRGGMGEV